MMRGHFKVSDIIMGSLAKGEDLLLSLQKICSEEHIVAGRIEVIGMVKHATLACYHQKTKKYEQVKHRKHMEIVACHGNITLKDGKPWVGLHTSLADHEGNMFGGILFEGTEIFMAEYTIAKYEGDPMERHFDEETGLDVF